MKQNQLKVNGNYIYFEDIGDSIVLYDIVVESIGKGYINALVSKPDGYVRRKLLPSSCLSYNIISSKSELINYTKKPISKHYSCPNIF